MAAPAAVGLVTPQVDFLAVQELLVKVTLAVRVFIVVRLAAAAVVGHLLRVRTQPQHLVVVVEMVVMVPLHL
jgi:hypothetical protein